MAYEKPELLLVASAESLILGGDNGGTDSVQDPIELPFAGSLLGLDE